MDVAPIFLTGHYLFLLSKKLFKRGHFGLSAKAGIIDFLGKWGSFKEIYPELVEGLAAKSPLISTY